LNNKTASVKHLPIVPFYGKFGIDVIPYQTYLKRGKRMQCKNCEATKILARGLCAKCYNSLIEKKKSDFCIGCKEYKPIKAKGMCRKCYARFQRHGDPTRERKKKGDKLCSYCHKKLVHAKTLCSSCYARYLKNGKPDRVKVKVKKECTFCGYFGFVRAKGLCNTCYTRLYRTGSVEYTKMKKVATCGFCKEEKEIKAKGLCGACYSRARRNGTPEYTKIKKVCSVEGCECYVKSQDLCEKHYKRWKRHGHTNQTRPKGWGSKKKHPLYNIWCEKKRKSPKVEFCEEWKDFWVFAADVGEKPSSKHKFLVIDSNKVIDKDNYEWATGIVQQRDDEADEEFRKRYNRHWRKKNQAKSQNCDFKKKYNITVNDYGKMYKKQNGVCAICGKPETMQTKTGKIMRLAVDHCHSTGNVRGLLCKACNTSLGGFKDSTKILSNAINYLNKLWVSSS